ncbi:hypothetical protein [Synechococcus sp.]|uniref:hypothetical protein n=1 Tax=Synechococcus sp. TaxID=1131 RepID=UPI0034A17551
MPSPPCLRPANWASAAGNDDLITELLGFPNAAHDDLVDAFCQGVIWLQNQHWRRQRQHCRKTAALLPLMGA